MNIEEKTSLNHDILVVEDSPEDYEAIRRAFKAANMANPLYRCEDGDMALDYLYRRGRYTDASKAPRPGVILLDLNLPGTDGYEVLAEIKQDPNLRAIPVIILTSSSDERDVESCYQAGANSYVSKPVDLAGFLEAIKRLKGFWFEIVLLPKGEEGETS